MNRNSLIYTVVFTFLTAFFFVFLLALANGATAGLVAENRRLSVQQSVLFSLNLLPEDPQAVAEEYDKRFNRIPEPGDLLKTSLEGQPVSVKYFSGAGLWGTITGVLAVDDSLERIIGLDVISHNETPGLGGRIDEEWFREQFRGERIPEEGITVAKGTGAVDTDRENGRVDGITGASLTSKSVETIINTELGKFRNEGAADE